MSGRSPSTAKCHPTHPMSDLWFTLRVDHLTTRYKRPGCGLGQTDTVIYCLLGYFVIGGSCSFAREIKLDLGGLWSDVTFM